VFPKGKHDDLVDSITKALKHFRRTRTSVLRTMRASRAGQGREKACIRVRWPKGIPRDGSTVQTPRDEPIVCSGTMRENLRDKKATPVTVTVS
jgi:hypothetical protein